MHYLITRKINVDFLQTMAMEWPDYEKEAKRKAKAKRQKQRDESLDDFIIDDSSDGENLGAKVKKRKLACKFILSCLSLFRFSTFSLFLS